MVNLPSEPKSVAEYLNELSDALASGNRQALRKPALWAAAIRGADDRDAVISATSAAAQSASDDCRGAWGQALAALGRHEEALDQYRSSIGSVPSEAWTESLEALKWPDTEVAAIEKAIKEADEPRAYKTWSRTLEATGRKAEAAVQLDIALGLGPHTRLSIRRGRLLAELDQPMAALKEYRIAIEGTLNPAAEAAQWIGYFHEIGVTDIIKLIVEKLSPESLAKVIEQAAPEGSETQREIDAIETAVDTVGDCNLFYFWATTLLHLGLHDRAAETFRKAIDNPAEQDYEDLLHNDHEWVPAIRGTSNPEAMVAAFANSIAALGDETFDFVWAKTLTALSHTAEAIDAFIRAIEGGFGYYGYHGRWVVVSWTEALKHSPNLQRDLARFAGAIESAESGDCFCLWGTTLVGLGYFDEAIAAFAEGIPNAQHVSPDSTDWLKAIHGASNTASAAATLSNAVERRDDATHLNEWADTLVSLGWPDEAPDFYRKALVRGAGYWVTSGRAWLVAIERAEDQQAEVEAFEAAVTAFNKGGCFKIWGRVLARLELHKAALIHYAKAIALGEYDGGGEDYTGDEAKWEDSLSRLEDRREVIQAFDEALGTSKTPHVRFAWAMALSNCNEYALALSEFEKCIAAEPTRGIYYYGCGLILQKMKRHEEAVDRFDEALLRFGPLDFNCVNVSYMKARSLDRLGRYDDARWQLARTARYHEQFRIWPTSTRPQYSHWLGWTIGAPVKELSLRG